MVVVQQQLFLQTQQGEVSFAVRVFIPEPWNDRWRCRYQVDWPEGQKDRWIMGADALQALVLALHAIGAELYTSSYHAEGRLRAYPKEQGYGFPVPSSLRDLLVGADAVSF